jgi:hypothetical protein
MALQVPELVCCPKWYLLLTLAAGSSTAPDPELVPMVAGVRQAVAAADVGRPD